MGLVHEMKLNLFANKFEFNYETKSLRGVENRNCLIGMF